MPWRDIISSSQLRRKIHCILQYGCMYVYNVTHDHFLVLSRHDRILKEKNFSFHVGTFQVEQNFIMISKWYQSGSKILIKSHFDQLRFIMTLLWSYSAWVSSSFYLCLRLWEEHSLPLPRPAEATGTSSLWWCCWSNRDSCDSASVKHHPMDSSPTLFVNSRCMS